jgi:hypothetical protein
METEIASAIYVDAIVSTEKIQKKENIKRPDIL